MVRESAAAQDTGRKNSRWLQDYNEQKMHTKPCGKPLISAYLLGIIVNFSKWMCTVIQLSEKNVLGFH